ncbi:hypothetical protein TrVGV298_007741 [Trichoderma virens]|nr:hypothetical protein TrVGV298_007741 [Trichoderma virens]
MVAAKNSENALAILQGACAAKLTMILQVHADGIDHTTPLLIPGIHSLILSGASFADICQDALVLLLPTLTFSAETSTPVADTSPTVNNGLLSSANMQQLRVPSSAPTEASRLKLEDNASALMSMACTGPSSVPEGTPQEESSYERASEMAPDQSRLSFLKVYLEDKATYFVQRHMSGNLQSPRDSITKSGLHRGQRRLWPAT